MRMAAELSRRTTGGTFLAVLVAATLTLGAAAATCFAQAAAPETTAATAAPAAPTATAAPVAPAATPTPAPKVELPPGVVARVNGQDITREELQEKTLRFFAEQALGSMIQQAAIRQAAKEAGITFTPQDMDSALNDFFAKGRFPPDWPLAERRAKWLEQLAARGLTEEEFKKDFEVDLLLRKLVEHEAKIPEEQLRADFDRRHGEKLLLRHIVVKTEEEAKAVQEELKKGTAFEELAKTKSIDKQTAAEGGKLPSVFTRGMAEKLIEDAVFALKPTEMTAPLAWRGNWVILKLDGKLPPDGVKFEDEKAKIRQELADAQAQQLRPMVMQQIMSKAKIDRAPVFPVAKPAAPPAAPDAAAKTDGGK